MDSTKFNTTLLNQLDFNLSYLKKMIVDVDEHQMTTTPTKGLVNHASFTVGHIITSYGMINKRLGGVNTVNEDWKALFQRKGPGDPRLPATNADRYPSKEELIASIEEQHHLLSERIEVLSSDELETKIEWRFGDQFPTIGDLLTFICVNHYAMHLGQLAAWRREMGLPSALAKL